MKPNRTLLATDGRRYEVRTLASGAFALTLHWEHRDYGVRTQHSQYICSRPSIAHLYEAALYNELHPKPLAWHP